jgi:thiamine pyrophosphate-dependent acetolactate synthase large subunit-like protein
MEAVVRVLESEGVDTVFGIPGAVSLSGQAHTVWSTP